MTAPAVRVSPNSIEDSQEPPLATAAPRRKLVHVRELDGVRGLAALAVFLHHVCYATLPADGWGGGIRLLSSVSRFGTAGVDLFFVLSGFLITSLLIEDRNGPRYYHDFYWKRALRILPLYFVCLLGVLLFYPHSGTYVLLSTFFVANFAWFFHIDASGPFWTLAIEEQFYLLWPTVVRRRSTEVLSYWALAIGMSAVILRVIAARSGHHNYQFTFFHCDGLAVGAWLACRFERWQRLGGCTSLEKGAWAASLLAAAGLAVAAFRLHGGPATEALGAACNQTSVTLLAGALIAFLLLNRGSSLLRVFRSAPLTFFGLISYAIYMIHGYVLWVYDRYVAHPNPGDLAAYSLRLFTVLGVTIVLSLLSRHLLELPAMSLRRYVLKTR